MTLAQHRCEDEVDYVIATDNHLRDVLPHTVDGVSYRGHVCSLS
jgi:hypothetical protein